MTLSNEEKRNHLTQLIEESQKGGGEDSSDNLVYGGGINQNVLNSQFRGWGFTFLR